MLWNIAESGASAMRKKEFNVQSVMNEWFSSEDNTDKLLSEYDTTSIDSKAGNVRELIVRKVVLQAVPSTTTLSTTLITNAAEDWRTLSPSVQIKTTSV